MFVVHSCNNPKVLKLSADAVAEPKIGERSEKFTLPSIKKWGSATRKVLMRKVLKVLLTLDLS